MSYSRVAVVTGANKGIGYEVVKRLLVEPSVGSVLVGARNPELGAQAVRELKNDRASFLLIDVDNEETIISASTFVKEKYGGLDILVNNAGMAWKGDAWGAEVAETSIKTNYSGSKLMCQHFLPIMNPGGRVVNVSSTAGALSKIKSEELREKFLKPDLTIQELDGLLDLFVQSVKDDTYEKVGFPKSCYGMSKLGMSTFTRILQSDEKYKHLLINACCPGWCKTDMSSQTGMKTPEEGADTPTWLALQPSDSELPMGFYSDRTIRNW